MKNKLLFVFICIAIAITSCKDKCIQTHLADDEREWFLCYNNEDKVIFRSNLGKLDTIKIIEKTESFTNPDCNILALGDLQKEYIYIEFKPNKCGNIGVYCGGEISITKDRPDEKIFPFFRVFGLEYSPYLQNDNLICKKITLSTNKKNYIAYRFEENVNSTNYGNEYLKSFDWDKKDGLIRYEAKNGEIFEFLKKLKP